MEGNSKQEEAGENAYYAEMADAWVFSDNTFGHQPYDQRRAVDTPCPPNPRNVYVLERALHGLNSLQLAHDAPISVAALDTAIGQLHQSQPYAVRAACRVLPPNGPDLWGLDELKANLVLGELALGPENDGRNVEFFTKLAFWDMDEERDARPDQRDDPLDKGKGKARPDDDKPPRYHVVWPILVADQYGEDWITLIWTQTMRHDEYTHYAEIQEFHVIDPRLDARLYASNFHEYGDRRARILKRFESLLANLDATCVVTFAPGCVVEDDNGTRLESYWYSPEMPMDEHSSGERCYAVVRQWMWKLTHECYPHADGNNAAMQSSGAVLRAVNPYFERMAMLGSCAWVAMGALSFWARVTIESLPEQHRFPVLVNERERTVYLDELAGPEWEPRVGRPMRQLDHERGQAREEQDEAESQRERSEAAARDAAARETQAQAPVSGATTQAPDPQQPPHPPYHAESHQQLAANMDWILTPPPPRNLFEGSQVPLESGPQLAHTNAPPELKSGNDPTVGALGSPAPHGSPLERRESRRGAKTQSQGVSTPPRGEVVDDCSGSSFDSDSSDCGFLGPPPKMKSMGTDDPSAQDKAVRFNKRPATADPWLDLCDNVTPPDKRQRSQTPGAESPPSDGTPLVLTNPFSTPSPGGGLLRTPAKRGIYLLPSSPATRASPRHHDAPRDASAAPDPSAVGSSGLASVPAGIQNTAANDGTAAATSSPQRHAKPAPAPQVPGPDQGGLDYDHMNRVFGNLPGSFPLSGDLTNKDERNHK